MNVLSLFDGMSCGQIALNRLGITYDNYFASEIDKYAIKVTMANYPDTIQIGCVTKVRAKDLPKIDLMMGGSPCQGFSRAGKQLNFDDPRSKLFFEFVRLLKECKPKYFLLENVRMKKEYQDIISEYLGVEPITINSALVSAQNRVRLYWTNIPNITQPKDRGILLKDVLEVAVKDAIKKETSDKYAPHGGKYADPYNKTEIKGEKATTLRTNSSNGNMWVRGAAKRNQVTKRGIEAQLNIRKDEKSNCVVASWSHKLNGCVEYRHKSKCVRASGRGSYDRHEWDSVGNKGSEMFYRKLTPMECERLQTVPDQFTNYVSDTQRYKVLGNGWTVDVIGHILVGIISDKRVSE